MRIAVLGTGVVGRTLARGFASTGRDVVVGTRDPSTGVAEWDGRTATFADAAREGDVVVLALNGEATPGVVAGLGDACDGKLVVDVTNPLDTSEGMPPRLSTAPGTSLGEHVQAALPAARVVKALNTVNCEVMVDPSRIPGEHSLLVAGDDDGAKAELRQLLAPFGWPDSAYVDLGGIPGARASEAYVLLWVQLFLTGGSPDVSIRVVRA